MPRSIIFASRVLFVCALAVITYLSLTPSPPSVPSLSDKIAHLLAYAALAFLLVLSTRPARTGILQVIIFVALIVGYGIIIEAIQRFTGRQFDVRDMGMNAAGAAAGAAAAMFLRNLVSRRGKSKPAVD